MSQENSKDSGKKDRRKGDRRKGKCCLLLWKICFVGSTIEYKVLVRELSLPNVLCVQWHHLKIKTDLCLLSVLAFDTTFFGAFCAVERRTFVLWTRNESFECEAMSFKQSYRKLWLCSSLLSSFGCGTISSENTFYGLIKDMVVIWNLWYISIDLTCLLYSSKRQKERGGEGSTNITF